jgi:hypothetical protein
MPIERKQRNLSTAVPKMYVWTKRGLGATKKKLKDKPQLPQEMQDSTQRSHPQNTPSCSEIQTKALFSIMSSAKVGSNMSTTRLFYNRVNTTNYKLKRGVEMKRRSYGGFFKRGSTGEILQLH